MKNEISIVIPYYNSVSMIPIQVKTWNSYSELVKKSIKIILVDDGSSVQQRLHTNLPKDLPVSIELYEIQEDIPWNECGANNLGMTVATTTWILRDDFDYLIPNATLETLINSTLDENQWYQFQARFSTEPNQPTNALGIPPNIYLITKEMFWSVGGYDEDFRGMYGSDLLFRHYLNIKRRPSIFKELYVEAYYNGSTHSLTRDPSQAYKLVEQKKSGVVPLSSTYLRFRWTRVR